MKIEHTRYEDIDDIMRIINQAKSYFKNHHINQWQDGYPNEESIQKDINQNKSYVLINNDRIIGTMYFAIEDDPSYSYIENGHWITSHQPYAVIHRIVVDEKLKGQNLAYELVQYAVNQCKNKHIQSIRIDTHQDNLSMQAFLKKHDFKPCGTIYLENGDPRIAFEKILA